MARLPPQPAEQHPQEKSGVETICLGAASIPGHSHAARVDDVRLNAARHQPTRQPKTIPPGLISDDEMLDLSSR
jgi:hypothetical protein